MTLFDELKEATDNVAPEDTKKELARLCDLCQRAADELADREEIIDILHGRLAEASEDPYRVLSDINVNEHTENKNGLTYLSWAWAWEILMSYYPDSETFINRPESGMPYWTDGMTAWVDVGVTVRWNGRERTRTEVFPIMDYKNNSIPVDRITSFNVNTALQRAWTKCIARHGLGFYIYAGEDLPNKEREEAEAKKRAEEEQAKQPCTDEQVIKIQSLYSEDEVNRMLRRMKRKSVLEVTKAEAEKMIKKRDMSLVTDPTPTF